LITAEFKKKFKYNPFGSASATGAVKYFQRYLPRRNSIFNIVSRCAGQPDRLAWQGLDHPSGCLHCDQDAETVNHLLVDCVFARDFWFGLLQKVDMQSISPWPGEISFEAWWDRASRAAGGF